MIDKTTDGAARVLVMRLGIGKLANLGRVPQTIGQHLPPGYTLVSLEVKAYLERTGREDK